MSAPDINEIAMTVTRVDGSSMTCTLTADTELDYPLMSEAATAAESVLRSTLPDRSGKSLIDKIMALAAECDLDAKRFDDEGSWGFARLKREHADYLRVLVQEPLPRLCGCPNASMRCWRNSETGEGGHLYGGVS